MLAIPVIWGVSAVAALPRANAGNPVLVIAWPVGASADSLILRAGGYGIGLDAPPLGKLGHSQDADFIDRLRALKPLLLLDANRLPSFLCGANV
ncbi:hypothetical protein [Jannaschia pohangensis]|nr:hypothetical protein [Jannaschia pohangensis]